MQPVTTKELKEIDELVKHFEGSSMLFKNALHILEGYIKNSDKLQALIHSSKSRIKDPGHLRDKLIRKWVKAKDAGISSDLTKETLFAKVNDLVGIRIIHLYTKQMYEIDQELKRIFAEYKLDIIEGPTARTWDDESRDYFTKIGIAIQQTPNPNMYTSVHYIVKLNSTSEVTCEIQVRTLMEEVWGEVDHTINYPHQSKSMSCREQLKVLARVTSGCSRLVDSIFSTQEEYNRFSSSNGESAAVRNSGTKKKASKKKNTRRK